MIHFSSGVSYIIYLSLNDLDPPFVDHLGHYLSACPIRHPLWPSMSWGSQDSTVQEYFPHKCGQKVSYKTFNAVAVTFPQIFPSSHSSCTFIMHVFINRTSWNVTLDDRRHILIFVAFSRGNIPPRTTSPSLYNHSLLVKFEVLRLSCYWSILKSRSLLGQGPIYIWVCVPTNIMH